MIPFDTSRRPAKPSEWQGLMEAILLADPNDEYRWVEWKSGVDWSSGDHVGGVVARAILGMANRTDPPSDLGGAGLVVIGLEPNNVAGVEPLDPADLESKLAPYLGEDVGPAFDFRWHTMEGKKVLSIEVPNPPPGSPIYPLRKGTTNYRSGAIFVRGIAKTEQATAVQVDALVARARAVAHAVEIEISPAPGSELRRVTFDPAHVWAYVEIERERLMKDTKTPPKEESHYARILPNVFGSEDRSVETFTREVEKYLAELREKLPGALDDFAAASIPATRLLATNTGGRNLPGLRVNLYLSGGVRVLDSEEDDDGLLDRLPRPPRKYGTPRGGVTIDYAHQMRGLSKGIARNLGGPSRREIENGDPAIVRLDEIDLRTGDTLTTIEDEIVLLVPATHAGPVEIRWDATSAGFDGRAEGSFSIPTSAKEVTDLLRAALTADQRKR